MGQIPWNKVVLTCSMGQISGWNIVSLGLYCGANVGVEKGRFRFVLQGKCQGEIR